MANDNFNLPRPTAPVPSGTSAVTEDNARVFDYVVNSTGTVVTRTGKTILTLDEAIKKFGFGIAPFTFAAGGTLTSLNLLVSNSPTDGFLYKYVGTGNAPVVVNAGTDPMVGGDWQAFAASDLQSLTGLTSPSDLAQRHRIKTTVAEIATGVFKVGDRLEVSDRNRGHYIIESGTANAYDKIAAGAGMIARYQPSNGWVLAKQVGFVAVDTGVPTIINDAAWNAIVNNSTYQNIAFEQGRYGFNTISFDRQFQELNLGTAIMFGLASSPTRCLFSIRQGNTSRIIGGKFTGAQNLNYTCGVHWYTNDLNTYFPGKLTWHDTIIGEFKLGLNVGMLASQTTYYAQNTVQAEGIATDAPISECDVSGLKIVDCPSAFRIAQPNGKLLISDSYIAAEGLGWGVQTAKETWKAVVLQGWGECNSQAHQ